jgi:hypothetical protein
LTEWRRGKTSGHPSGSRCGEDDEGPFEPVATVVVENDFEQVVPLAARSDSGSTNRTPGASGTGLSHGPTTKEGSSLFGKSEGRTDQEGDEEAVADSGSPGGGSTKASRQRKDWKKRVQRSWIYEFLFVTVWPSIVYFFNMKYSDPSKERAFTKEVSTQFGEW